MAANPGRRQNRWVRIRPGSWPAPGSALQPPGMSLALCSGGVQDSCAAERPRRARTTPGVTDDVRFWLLVAPAVVLGPLRPQRAAGDADPQAGGPAEIVGGSTGRAVIGRSPGQRPGVVLMLWQYEHGSWLSWLAGRRPARSHTCVGGAQWRRLEQRLLISLPEPLLSCPGAAGAYLPAPGRTRRPASRSAGWPGHALVSRRSAGGPGRSHSAAGRLAARAGLVSAPPFCARTSVAPGRHCLRRTWAAGPGLIRPGASYLARMGILFLD
jgi:hypothetical protein